MASTDDQRYAGPERRARDRTPPPPPRVIGRARLRPEAKRLYPGCPPADWYDVVDRNPATTPAEAHVGYVWVAVSDRLEHVPAAHLELEPATVTQRRPLLSDDHVRLLTRIEGGETTFRSSSAMQAGDSLERLVARLLNLRERGLVEPSDSRIMRTQAGRTLGAGPCGLTAAGREALERDRRLGPRP